MEERQNTQDGLKLGDLVELVTRRWFPIAVCAVLGLGVAFGVLWRRSPTYRASATLLLDDDRQSGGILGELAMISSAPAAASEMEILRSRTIAERVVGLAGPEESADSGGLNLTVLVEDEGLRPLAALAGLGRAEAAPRARAFAPPPRLTAEVTELEPGYGAEAVRLHFIEADRVELSLPGLLSSLGFGDADPITTQFVRGMPLEYAGLRLSLTPAGDPTGRTWTVYRLDAFDAVERVMARTTIGETTRGSGVLRVTFDGTDPRRAAETVNALCQAYLEANKTRGERRASQTVRFIDEQLESQIESLGRAEEEIVKLQTANPTAINVAKTASELITRLSELEVERVRGGLAQVGLREALSLLEAGDTYALSRLGPELADPISAAYIERIAALTAESDLLDRSDAVAQRSQLRIKLLEAENQLVELEGLERELASTVDELRAGDRAAYGGLVGANSFQGDPLAAGYASELAEIQARRSRLLEEFTDKHPEVVRLAGSIDDVHGRLTAHIEARLESARSRAGDHRELVAVYQERIDGVTGDERGRIETAVATLRERTNAHLRSRLAGFDVEGRSLDEEIERLEGRLGELPEEERLLADPLRRMEAHTEIVKFLLGRQQEAEITRAATVAAADFIDPATPPRDRIAPSIVLSLLAGLVAGLFGGVLLAFGLESLDQKIFTASELEEATGLSVLGSLPNYKRGRFRVPGAKDDFLSLRDDPEGPVAEAVRSLRTNLKFVLGDGSDVKAIAVTSSSPGEGKSTTNLELAAAFGAAGKRVLIVDADMRRPSVHRKLGIERAPGTSDVLSGEYDWRDCVRRDVFPGVDALPSGPQPARPSDLLDGAAADDLVAETRLAYDYVIFDVPPVLAVSDIGSFAGKLDGVFLLCRSEKLKRRVLLASTMRLRQAGANLLGSVLNAAKPNRRDDKYGYGYGYCYESDKAA